MLKSSRFIALLISSAMFAAMIFLTDYKPLELASAISMLMGIFIVNKSLRPSDMTESNKK